MLNSLKIKILGLVTLIVIVIITASALVNFALQRRMVVNIAERDSLVLTETIKSAITEAMLSNHSEEIRNIFNRIKEQRHIKGLRILDESGNILNAADISEIGRISHSKGLETFRNGQPITLNLDRNDKIFYSITPILNGPGCTGCHEPAQKILGILEIEIPLDHIYAFLLDSKKNAVISTAIIILLIIISISFFLIRYLDSPIRQLINSMQNVEKGNFDSKTIITSSNEMQLLSSNYNRMVDRLKDLMVSTVNNERELARAQEKLMHHRQIVSMNNKMSEQLKEIENLNISLEEQIEEIEEANYKIADLAGELEDKNSNLENAIARLSTLHKVGLGINSTMDLDTLFNLVVQTTMDTLHAKIGYMMLIEPDAASLRTAILVGHEVAPPADVVISINSPGVSPWVIKNRSPLLITNIADHPHFNRFSRLGYERNTLISVPLVVKDEIIGTINVVNKFDNTAFNNEDLELLITIAGQASIAIKNAKLYEEQQRTYLNTIHALVSAIEANDSYTRGHSERVTRYSLMLAKKLNLPASRLKIIERAAILHDIGKIGIDLTLLNKSGPLSPEEMLSLQQHPAIGIKILEPIEFLQDVRLCISQHHERFDGNGYPNQTAGDELLLEARILAIADSFDAMTSDRPYRKALTIEVALQEILDHAGTQFDPELAMHFVSLFADSALKLKLPKKTASRLSHVAA